MFTYIAALCFPCLMVMLFSRVTYHPIIGLLLTVGLIAASVYKGYTDTFFLIVIDAFSMTVGFFLSNHFKKRVSDVPE